MRSKEDIDNREGKAPGRAGSGNPGASPGDGEAVIAGARVGHLLEGDARGSEKRDTFVSIGSVAKEIVRKIVEGRG